MWLRTLEGWTWMGWMSATVSTSMPFFNSSSFISSVSARIDTTSADRDKKRIKINYFTHYCMSTDTLYCPRVESLLNPWPSDHRGHRAHFLRRSPTNDVSWELTLYNHIRLGDGGEMAVKWVNLSRSKKSLKKWDRPSKVTVCKSTYFVILTWIVRILNNSGQDWFIALLSHRDIFKCCLVKWWLTSLNRFPRMYRDWPHFRGHLPIGILSTECGFIYSSSTCVNEPRKPH